MEDSTPTKTTVVEGTLSGSEPSSTVSTVETTPSQQQPPQVPTASQDANPDEQREGEIQYVTGYKLAIIIASVALSCFLMLLDTMIVSTVSPLCPLD
jgi:hypothetical protein